MSGKHKYPPIGLRLPADSDDREWLFGYAKRTGRPVNAILTDAVRLFRAQAQEDGTTITLRKHQPQTPRKHAQTCKCGTCQPKEGKR